MFLTLHSTPTINVVAKNLPANCADLDEPYQDVTSHCVLGFALIIPPSLVSTVYVKEPREPAERTPIIDGGLMCEYGEWEAGLMR